MKTLFAITLGFSTLFMAVSCTPNSTKNNDNSEVEMGTLDGQKYTCKEIGWETSYPKDAAITPLSDLKSLKERTQRAAGQDPKEDDGIKYLLSYDYDFNNSFQSTVQDFKGKSDADYTMARNGIHASAYENYYNNRIRVDSTAAKKTIGNVTFDVWTLNLYNEKAEAYAHQEMYTAVINGYFFSAVLAYDDKFYRSKMLPTITKAKYK